MNPLPPCLTSNTPRLSPTHLGDVRWGCGFLPCLQGPGEVEQSLLVVLHQFEEICDADVGCEHLVVVICAAAQLTEAENERPNTRFASFNQPNSVQIFVVAKGVGIF